MGSMRDKLTRFRLQRRGQDDRERREAFDEAMYTRDFHSQAESQNAIRPDRVKIHHVRSLARLYQLGELEPYPSQAAPNGLFNHTVCLLNGDITNLEVDVIVNCTDAGFSGYGTLGKTFHFSPTY